MSENKNTVLDEEETRSEISLRPTRLEEFVGQEKLKENLKVFIEAARGRKESLDHCNRVPFQAPASRPANPAITEGLS